MSGKIVSTATCQLPDSQKQGRETECPHPIPSDQDIPHREPDCLYSGTEVYAAALARHMPGENCSIDLGTRMDCLCLDGAHPGWAWHQPLPAAQHSDVSFCHCTDTPSDTPYFSDDGAKPDTANIQGPWRYIDNGALSVELEYDASEEAATTDLESGSDGAAWTGRDAENFCESLWPYVGSESDGQESTTLEIDTDSDTVLLQDVKEHGGASAEMEAESDVDAEAMTAGTRNSSVTLAYTEVDGGSDVNSVPSRPHSMTDTKTVLMRMDARNDGVTEWTGPEKWRGTGAVWAGMGSEGDAEAVWMRLQTTRETEAILAETDSDTKAGVRISANNNGMVLTDADSDGGSHYHRDLENESGDGLDDDAISPPVSPSEPTSAVNFIQYSLILMQCQRQQPYRGRHLCLRLLCGDCDNHPFLSTTSTHANHHLDNSAAPDTSSENMHTGTDNRLEFTPTGAHTGCETLYTGRTFLPFSLYERTEPQLSFDDIGRQSAGPYTENGSLYTDSDYNYTWVGSSPDYDITNTKGTGFGGHYTLGSQYTGDCSSYTTAYPQNGNDGGFKNSQCMMYADGDNSLTGSYTDCSNTSEYTNPDNNGVSESSDTDAYTCMSQYNSEISHLLGLNLLRRNCCRCRNNNHTPENQCVDSGNDPCMSCGLENSDSGNMYMPSGVENDDSDSLYLASAMDNGDDDSPHMAFSVENGDGDSLLMSCGLENGDGSSVHMAHSLGNGDSSSLFMVYDPEDCDTNSLFMTCGDYNKLDGHCCYENSGSDNTDNGTGSNSDDELEVSDQREESTLQDCYYSEYDSWQSAGHFDDTVSENSDHAEDMLWEYSDIYRHQDHHTSQRNHTTVLNSHRGQDIGQCGHREHRQDQCDKSDNSAADTLVSQRSANLCDDISPPSSSEGFVDSCESCVGGDMLDQATNTEYAGSRWGEEPCPDTWRSEGGDALEGKGNVQGGSQLRCLFTTTLFHCSYGQPAFFSHVQDTQSRSSDHCLPESRHNRNQHKRPREFLLNGDSHNSYDTDATKASNLPTGYKEPGSSMVPLSVPSQDVRFSASPPARTFLLKITNESSSETERPLAFSECREHCDHSSSQLPPTSKESNAAFHQSNSTFTPPLSCDREQNGNTTLHQTLPQCREQNTSLLQEEPLRKAESDSAAPFVTLLYQYGKQSGGATPLVTLLYQFREQGDGPTPFLTLPYRSGGKGDCATQLTQPGCEEQNDSATQHTEPNYQDQSDSATLHTQPIRQDQSDSATQHTKPICQDQSDGATQHTQPICQEQRDSATPFLTRPHQSGENDDQTAPLQTIQTDKKYNEGTTLHQILTENSDLSDDVVPRQTLSTDTEQGDSAASHETLSRDRERCDSSTSHNHLSADRKRPDSTATHQSVSMDRQQADGVTPDQTLARDRKQSDGTTSHQTLSGDREQSEVTTPRGQTLSGDREQINGNTIHQAVPKDKEGRYRGTSQQYLSVERKQCYIAASHSVPKDRKQGDGTTPHQRLPEHREETNGVTPHQTMLENRELSSGAAPHQTLFKTSVCLEPPNSTHLSGRNSGVECIDNVSLFSQTASPSHETKSDSSNRLVTSCPTVNNQWSDAVANVLGLSSVRGLLPSPSIGGHQVSTAMASDSEALSDGLAQTRLTQPTCSTTPWLQTNSIVTPYLPHILKSKLPAASSSLPFLHLRSETVHKFCPISGKMPNLQRSYRTVPLLQPDPSTTSMSQTGSVPVKTSSTTASYSALHFARQNRDTGCRIPLENQKCQPLPRCQLACSERQPHSHQRWHTTLPLLKRKQQDKTSLLPTQNDEEQNQYFPFLQAEQDKISAFPKQHQHADKTVPLQNQDGDTTLPFLQQKPSKASLSQRQHQTFPSKKQDWNKNFSLLHQEQNKTYSLSKQKQHRTCSLPCHAQDKTAPLSGQEQGMNFPVSRQEQGKTSASIARQQHLHKTFTNLKQDRHKTSPLRHQVPDKTCSLSKQQQHHKTFPGTKQSQVKTFPLSQQNENCSLSQQQHKTFPPSIEKTFSQHHQHKTPPVSQEQEVTFHLLQQHDDTACSFTLPDSQKPADKGVRPILSDNSGDGTVRPLCRKEAMIRAAYRPIRVPVRPSLPPTYTQPAGVDTSSVSDNFLRNTRPTEGVCRTSSIVRFSQPTNGNGTHRTDERNHILRRTFTEREMAVCDERGDISQFASSENVMSSSCPALPPISLEGCMNKSKELKGTNNDCTNTSLLIERPPAQQSLSSWHTQTANCSTAELSNYNCNAGHDTDNSRCRKPRLCYTLSTGPVSTAQVSSKRHSDTTLPQIHSEKCDRLSSSIDLVRQVYCKHLTGFPVLSTREHHQTAVSRMVIKQTTDTQLSHGSLIKPARCLHDTQAGGEVKMQALPVGGRQAKERTEPTTNPQVHPKHIPQLTQSADTGHSQHTHFPPVPFKPRHCYSSRWSCEVTGSRRTKDKAQCPVYRNKDAGKNHLPHLGQQNRYRPPTIHPSDKLCPNTRTHSTNQLSPLTYTHCIREYVSLVKHTLDQERPDTHTAEYPHPVTHLTEHPIIATRTVDKERAVTHTVDPLSFVTHTLDQSCPIAQTQYLSPITETMDQECPIAQATDYPSPVTEIIDHVCPIAKTTEYLSPVTETMDKVCPIVQKTEYLSPVAHTVDKVCPIAQTTEYVRPVLHAMDQACHVTHIVEHPRPAKHTADHPSINMHMSNPSSVIYTTDHPRSLTHTTGHVSPILPTKNQFCSVTHSEDAPSFSSQQPEHPSRDANQGKASHSVSCRKTGVLHDSVGHHETSHQLRGRRPKTGIMNPYTSECAEPFILRCTATQGEHDTTHSANAIVPVTGSEGSQEREENSKSTASVAVTKIDDAVVPLTSNNSAESGGTRVSTCIQADSQSQHTGILHTSHLLNTTPKKRHKHKEVTFDISVVTRKGADGGNRGECQQGEQLATQPLHHQVCLPVAGSRPSPAGVHVPLSSSRQAVFTCPPDRGIGQSQASRSQPVQPDLQQAKITSRPNHPHASHRLPEPSRLSTAHHDPPALDGQTVYRPPHRMHTPSDQKFEQTEQPVHTVTVHAPKCTLAETRVAETESHIKSQPYAAPQAQPQRESELYTVSETKSDLYYEPKLLTLTKSLTSEDHQYKVAERHIQLEPQTITEPPPQPCAVSRLPTESEPYTAPEQHELEEPCTGLESHLVLEPQASKHTHEETGPQTKLTQTIHSGSTVLHQTSNKHKAEQICITDKLKAEPTHLAHKQGCIRVTQRYKAGLTDRHMKGPTQLRDKQKVEWASTTDTKRTEQRVLTESKAAAMAAIRQVYTTSVRYKAPVCAQHVKGAKRRAGQPKQGTEVVGYQHVPLQNVQQKTLQCTTVHDKDTVSSQQTSAQIEHPVAQFSCQQHAVDTSQHDVPVVSQQHADLGPGSLAISSTSRPAQQITGSLSTSFHYKLRLTTALPAAAAEQTALNSTLPKTQFTPQSVCTRSLRSPVRTTPAKTTWRCTARFLRNVGKPTVHQLGEERQPLVQYLSTEGPGESCQTGTHSRLSGAQLLTGRFKKIRNNAVQSKDANRSIKLQPADVKQLGSAMPADTQHPKAETPEEMQPLSTERSVGVQQLSTEKSTNMQQYSTEKMAHTKGPVDGRVDARRSTNGRSEDTQWARTEGLVDTKELEHVPRPVEIEDLQQLSNKSPAGTQFRQGGVEPKQAGEEPAGHGHFVGLSSVATDQPVPPTRYAPLDLQQPCLLACLPEVVTSSWSNCLSRVRKFNKKDPRDVMSMSNIQEHVSVSTAFRQKIPQYMLKRASPHLRRRRVVHRHLHRRLEQQNKLAAGDKQGNTVSAQSQKRQS